MPRSTMRSGKGHVGPVIDVWDASLDNEREIRKQLKLTKQLEKGAPNLEPQGETVVNVTEVAVQDMEEKKAVEIAKGDTKAKARDKSAAVSEASEIVVLEPDPVSKESQEADQEVATINESTAVAAKPKAKPKAVRKPTAKPNPTPPPPELVVLVATATEEGTGDQVDVEAVEAVDDDSATEVADGDVGELAEDDKEEEKEPAAAGDTKMVLYRIKKVKNKRPILNVYDCSDVGLLSSRNVKRCVWAFDGMPSTLKDKEFTPNQALCALRAALDPTKKSLGNK